VKILYVASGIPVPGPLGGSTHTLEVARGLASRGHSVHVVAAAHEGWNGLAALARPVSCPYEGFFLHQITVPKLASLATLPLVLRLAQAIQPTVIIERYYNFAGTGLLAARRLGVPSLLEVNALIIDPPEVRKRRLDDALGGPMRRWAVAQCCMADRIVTPLHTTVPSEIDRARIIELPWGAAVERFAPARSTDPDAVPTVVFLGSFRSWHGVLDVVRAGAALLDQGYQCQFLLIGDGPERPLAEQLAAGWPGRFRFTGAVPYTEVPAYLAQATIGVAPFNTAPHPALRAAGFFWSPLKIYEYMAAGLPVVTADIHPLNQTIRDGVEGALFREGDIASLAAALARLLDHPTLAEQLGQQARERVVAHYSWAHHCAELETILQAMVERSGREVRHG
jgi:glycosyltransferase involved in cell wall biosynthesis